MIKEMEKIFPEYIREAVKEMFTDPVVDANCLTMFCRLMSEKHPELTNEQLFKRYRQMKVDAGLIDA